MNNLRFTATPHWMTIAHLPKWKTEQKNRLIVKIYHERNSNLEDFFSLSPKEWEKDFGLSSSQSASLLKAKDEIPNNSFYVENLLSQGFEIIPIISDKFSRILKTNLKVKHTPAVIYAKGNKQLLLKDSVAIVGSRKASRISLDFTDNIAKKAVSDSKVVVSGFAKGIDRQALESALKYNGQSIIVLPQGITTFNSGFRKYYKNIVEGNLLVLSTFHPRAKWSVGLAMARNPIIYGLANEIYVAESSQKGGTWEGVQDGLKKGRTIYVRTPRPEEKNANLTLIHRGAIPVDKNGMKPSAAIYTPRAIEPTYVCEPKNTSSNPSTTLDNNKIIECLSSNGPLSSKEILSQLQLDWSIRKMTNYLKSMDSLVVLNTIPLKFKIKSNVPKTLF